MPHIVIHELDREECLAYLRSAEVGRIGLSVGALPVILPVNFTIHHNWILIRTAAGSKLDAATRATVVAFEVDGFDNAAGKEWSVLVQGIASEIVDPEELRDARDTGLESWALDGVADHFVGVELTNVSGRRFDRDEH